MVRQYIMSSKRLKTMMMKYKTISTNYFKMMTKSRNNKRKNSLLIKYLYPNQKADNLLILEKMHFKNNLAQERKWKCLNSNRISRRKRVYV